MTPLLLLRRPPPYSLGNKLRRVNEEKRFTSMSGAAAPRPSPPPPFGIIKRDLSPCPFFQRIYGMNYTVRGQQSAREDAVKCEIGAEFKVYLCGAIVVAPEIMFYPCHQLAISNAYLIRCYSNWIKLKHVSLTHKIEPPRFLCSRPDL